MECLVTFLQVEEGVLGSIYLRAKSPSTPSSQLRTVFSTAGEWCLEVAVCVHHGLQEVPNKENVMDAFNFQVPVQALTGTVPGEV